MEILSKKILNYATYNKIPVYELEKRMGISSGTLSRILNNKSSTPSLETLIKISKYLKCSLNDLLEHEYSDPVDKKDASLTNISLYKSCLFYTLYFVETKCISMNYEDFTAVIRKIYDNSVKYNLNELNRNYADMILNSYLKS